MTLNNQGFSVVGAVVASTIGLIALTGMSKQMVMISQQQNQMNKERDLNAFWKQLETETDCKKTIKDWLDNTASPTQKAKLLTGTEGNDIEIKKIKTNTGTLLDISTKTDGSYTKPNNVFSRYGFFPRFFALRCLAGDDFNGGSCDCKKTTHTYNFNENHKDHSCKKKWVLIPGIQDGMTFIKGETLGLELTWKHPGPEDDISNFETAFDCSKLTLEPEPLQVNCLTVENSGGKRTLLGCGSTETIGGMETTAIGYDVADGAQISETAKANVFIGPKAGKGAKVGNGSNVFIGYESGKGTEILDSQFSGGENVFIGYGAGPKKVDLGGRNHFFGPYAGKGVTLGRGFQFANNNTFIGYEAGYNSTITGDSNTFIGYRAKAHVAGKSNETHIAGENVYIQGSIKLMGVGDCGVGKCLRGFDSNGDRICEDK